MVTTDDAYEARPRDPAATRRRILEAATAEFARWGFAGARVDRIALDAGVNKRMLYHYFGGKAGLHEAVLRVGLDTGGGPSTVTRAGLEAPAMRLLLWALLEDAPSSGRVPALDGLRLRLAQVLHRALDPGRLSQASKPRIRLKARRT